jgi:tetratricopeptide (TPR) repeat protein
MKFPISILLVLIFLGITPNYAQNRMTDSIENILKTCHDTVKIRLIENLAYELRKSDPNKGIELAKEGIRLAEKYKKTKQKSGLITTLGNIYLRIGLYNKSIDYFNQSLKIKQIIKDSTGIAACYTGLGNAYGYLGDYNNSEKYTQLAIDFSEKIGFKKSVAYNLSNMAIIYTDRGDNQKALQCYQRAFTINDQSGDKEASSSDIMNMAVIYCQTREYDKAIENIKKALPVKIEMNDKKSIALCYFNLGSLYFEEKKDIVKAKEYNQKAFEIASEIGDIYCLADIYTLFANFYIHDSDYYKSIEYNQKAMKIRVEIGDQYGLADTYIKLGTDYRQIKQYKLSEKYLNDAIYLLKEQGLRTTLYKAYHQMAYTQYKLHNLAKAFQYYELFSVLKDSCMDESAQKQITEMQTKYESEKKEKAIELLNKDKKLNQAELSRKEEKVRKQKILIYAFVLGFLLIFLFSILLFKQYSAKKKANILLAKQNEEIRQKKEEIESQRDEIEAQRDEIQIQKNVAVEQRDMIIEQKKEITDSIHYAQRIQHAMLPPENILNSFSTEHFILFKPRDIVSGDFYWSRIMQSKLILCAADCTGHGVPGAFMSMLGVASLNEIVNRYQGNNIENISASGILDELRDVIIRSLHQTGKEGESKDGMDIALVILDVNQTMANDKYNIQYAGANNSIYLISPDNLQPSLYKLTEIKADKMPVGMHEQIKPFTNHNILLKKGESVYIFSDGFADQFGGIFSKKFKYAQFKDLLDAVQEKPMAEQKLILENIINEWKGSNEQTDDILVIGLKI